VDEKITLEFLQRRIAHLKEEETASGADVHKLKADRGENTTPNMDLTTYRLDQAEKRDEAADVRMGRIESQLTQIQIMLAGLATKDSIRNWGIGVIAIVVATAIGLGAILLQSSGNQLSAFQSGLSAIEAVSAAHTLPPSPDPQQPTKQ